VVVFAAATGFLQQLNKKLCSHEHQAPINPRDLVGYGRKPAACQMAGSGPALRPVSCSTTRGVAKIASSTADTHSERFLSEIVGAEAFPRGIYEYGVDSTNSGSRAGVWRILKEFEKARLAVDRCSAVGGMGAGASFPPVAMAFKELGGTRLPARLRLDRTTTQDGPEAVEREHLQRAIEIFHQRLYGREAGRVGIPGREYARTPAGPALLERGTARYDSDYYGRRTCQSGLAPPTVQGELHDHTWWLAL